MLKPAPGIILIEKEQTNDDTIVITNTPKGRLLSGKIIAIGDDHITENGTKISVPCKIGQTAWFLSYEGNYDVARVDNKDIYFVLFRDLRGYK